MSAKWLHWEWLFSGRFESLQIDPGHDTEKPNIWTSNSFLISLNWRQKIIPNFERRNIINNLNVINTALLSSGFFWTWAWGLYVWHCRQQKSPFDHCSMPFIGSSPAYHQFIVFHSQKNLLFSIFCLLTLGIYSLYHPGKLSPF